MRIADALARFQTQLQADGRSPHTVAQYARHIRRFASWLQAEVLPDVARLEPEHVARFRASAGAQRCPSSARSNETARATSNSSSTGATWSYDLPRRTLTLQTPRGRGGVWHVL
jgi:site-specific recombinase XerD